MKTLLFALLLSAPLFAAHYECGHNVTIEVYAKKIVATLSDGYVSVYKRDKYGDYCKHNYNADKGIYSCIKQDGNTFNFITSADAWFVKCKRID